jgi:hypothetical protein
MYKWVRINAITVPSEAKAGVNVGSPGGSSTPLLYNNSTLTINPPGAQALEITSLASMGNGSQRMLQYVVAPITYDLNLLPAALTLMGPLGPNVTFTGPGASLTEDGTDTIAAPGCAPGGASVAGIGVGGGSDLTNITGQNVTPTPTPPAPPGASLVTVPSNLQSVGALETLAQTVENNRDNPILPGPQTQTVFPPWMSATAPATVAVDGDLDLSTWTGTGYGVLLVTGTLTYNPSSTWNGLVLVIGQGNVTSAGSGGGGFFGAVVVARTRDAGGNTLANFGPTSWIASGGATIKYSSCWVNNVQPPISYKILSFREIPQS